MIIITLSKSKSAKILEFSEVIQSSDRVITKETAKHLRIFEAALSTVKYGRLFLWHLQNDKNRAIKLSQGNFGTPCALPTNSILFHIFQIILRDHCQNLLRAQWRCCM